MVASFGMPLTRLLRMSIDRAVFFSQAICVPFRPAPSALILRRPCAPAHGRPEGRWDKAGKAQFS